MEVFGEAIPNVDDADGRSSGLQRHNRVIPLVQHM